MKEFFKSMGMVCGAMLVGIALTIPFGVLYFTALHFVFQYIKWISGL